MSKEILRPSQYAHVPAHLEQAVIMSDEQRTALARLYEENSATLQQGQLVTGTIVKVDNDGVLVDINYKSNGLIPRYEFAPYELKELLAGNAIEVILDQLESLDGTVVLSYEKAKTMRTWNKITKLFEENKPVQGVVTHRVKGGLNVDIGINAFLPGSQVDVQRVADFDQYVGQTITADIIKLNKKRGNVILSRRKYLNALRTESRKKILETLAEGNVVQGVVKNITNYGVFVDIGGVDGLLHITDMTWGRIGHPSELVKIGETITVKVLSIDKDNEKISLGMKQLSENPWDKVAESIKEGNTIKGTISSITDYGLFVEIAKGVEGLVHISEISWTNRITDLKKHFKVGDKVEALVVSIDKENRRMSLSIKQLEKNPWQTVMETFKIGDKIKGKITNITDFGIFVEILPGIDGLVHISDLSWTEHINHPSDKYAKDEEVEAVILAVDEANKKISLGIKQLEQNPWETLAQDYPIGSEVEGTVSKITNFGAFIKLPNGIEGLVHISELADEGVDKVEDILAVGEKRSFKVINVDTQERKIGLSLKTNADDSRKRRAPKATSSARTERKETGKPKSAFQRELERHMGVSSDDESEE